MKNALLQLKLAVDALYKMSPEAWEDFASIWYLVGVRNKEMISKPDSIENYYYFNLHGLQRLVHIDEAGKETTIELTYEGCFGGNLTSFLLRIPARNSFQALTNSKLLRCSYADLNRLMEKHAGIELFIRNRLTKTIETYIEHLIIVKSFSSVAKYNSIIQNQKLYKQKVPQKYMANHFGLDASNYSKIKMARYPRVKLQ
ncbi:CRP-like cAMP-binding protein [Flavobacteriaceae bacterium MAR_2010_105]|nr:CRP-like cAMP-binding protein [Flavobacteriaceae bacterium MAR_2010_105]